MQNMSNVNHMQNMNAKNILVEDLLSNSHAEVLVQVFGNSRRMTERPFAEKLAWLRLA
jgi:hypothetical protein